MTGAEFTELTQLLLVGFASLLFAMGYAAGVQA